MDKSVLQVHKVATIQIYYTSSYINKSKYWGRVPQGARIKGLYPPFITQVSQSNTRNKKERKKETVNIHPPHSPQQIHGLHLL